MYNMLYRLRLRHHREVNTEMSGEMTPLPSGTSPEEDVEALKAQVKEQETVIQQMRMEKSQCEHSLEILKTSLKEDHHNAMRARQDMERTNSMLDDQIYQVKQDLVFIRRQRNGYKTQVMVLESAIQRI